MMQHATHHCPASLLRRLGAIIYDTILCIALLGFATVLLLPFIPVYMLLNYNTFYNIYLIILLYGYFVMAWHNGGQTLGMKAWHIYLVSMDNSPLSFSQATIRFIVAIPALLLLGIGLFWSLTNKSKQTWQDLASNSQAVHIP